jgi:hypothetical protein
MTLELSFDTLKTARFVKSEFAFSNPKTGEKGRISAYCPAEAVIEGDPHAAIQDRAGSLAFWALLLTVAQSQNTDRYFAGEAFVRAAWDPIRRACVEAAGPVEKVFGAAFAARFFTVTGSKSKDSPKSIEVCDAYVSEVEFIVRCGEEMDDGDRPVLDPVHYATLLTVLLQRLQPLPGTSDTQPRAVEPEEQEPLALRLTFLVRREGMGHYSPVRRRADEVPLLPLRLGDQFRLHVRTSEPAHVLLLWLEDRSPQSTAGGPPASGERPVVLSAAPTEVYPLFPGDFEWTAAITVLTTTLASDLPLTSSEGWRLEAQGGWQSLVCLCRRTAFTSGEITALRTALGRYQLPAVAALTAPLIAAATPLTSTGRLGQLHQEMPDVLGLRLGRPPTAPPHPFRPHHQGLLAALAAVFPPTGSEDPLATVCTLPYQA